MLTGEQLGAVRTFICEGFAHRAPVSYSAVADMLRKNYKLEVNMNSLRSLLGRMPWCRTVTGVPQDDLRVHCDTLSIQRYLLGLENGLKNDEVPAKMVFNVDEVGFQDWADAMKIAVIVPTSYTGSQISIPVSRSSKKTSVIVAISAGGDWLKPLFVVGRKMVEIDLLARGYTRDKCIIVSQDKAFTNRAIFEMWVEQIFIPHVQYMRAHLQYGGWGCLILDGFAGHISGKITDLCKYWGISMIFLPPHTSDQLQPLDLNTFGLAKKTFSSLPGDADVSGQSSNIMKIYDSLVRSTTPNNVIAAFERAGIRSLFSKEHDCCIAKMIPDSCEAARQQREMSPQRMQLIRVPNAAPAG
jgi:hypothetical protein